MDNDAPTEEEHGLLFILDDPVVLLDSGEQAIAILLADEARHKMKAKMSYKQFSQTFENGRPSRMHRASTESVPNSSNLKRAFDIVLVDDEELRAFAEARNVKLKCEKLLRDLVTVSTASSSTCTDASDLATSHPTVSPATGFPIMLDTGPHRTGIIPQRGINTREDNSLIRVDPCKTSEFQGGADYMYILRLRLVPEEGNSRHGGLSVVSVSGRVYTATIDTGDSTFWLYQRGFRQIEWDGEDYWDEDPCLPKNTVPEGPRYALKERAKVRYSDSGWCGLRRWDFEDIALPLEVPAWNWKTNSQGRIVLEFPRILAERAGKLTINQPYDGNLGLAVPGWRHPWNAKIQPEARTTFFDVLANEGNPFVDTPSRTTLRLLWPRPAHELEGAPERMRSFLYFGKGYPCGIPGPDGKLITPQFGPKIFMTMPDWTPHQISMPDVDGGGGIRANLDSCSALTYLPAPVIRKIQTSWFRMRPDAPSFPIIVGNSDAWEKCDILFKFKGEGTSVVEFRCSALYFLTSPWRKHNGYVAPFHSLPDPSLEGPPQSATLGLNFFWSAIVRLDGTHRGDRPIPGVARPYVQLAPQRIIQDGRVVAGPWDIGIHENAPPRVQAAVRKQPDLHMA